MTKKFEVLRSRVLRGELLAYAGAAVYSCRYHDYGCASDDTRATGIEHVSVTLDPNGDYPFFTIPSADIRPWVDEPKPAPDVLNNDISLMYPDVIHPPMKTITLQGQWQCDGTVEAFESNGMLCIPDCEGVIYVTREQAQEFFGFAA